MHVSDDPRVGTEPRRLPDRVAPGIRRDERRHLAEDLRLKRRVALKLLAGDLAGDESFRDRFLHESEPRRLDRPSEHRPDLRGRDDRRPPLHRDALRRRPGPAASARARTSRSGGGDRHRRAGCERPGRCTRSRARPPRREALERAARHRCAPGRLGSRLPGRLRFDEAARRAVPTHGGRHAAGDDRLCRTGADRRGGGRRAGGRLLARLRAVRVPRRRAAVQARLGSPRCSRTWTRIHPRSAPNGRMFRPASTRSSPPLAKEPKRRYESAASLSCGRRSP